MTERERYCLALGAVLRLLREEKGLRQGELAARMDTSQPTLSRYERGEGCPTPWELRCLGKVTGRSVVQLLEVVEVAFATDVAAMPDRIARAALTHAAYVALQAAPLPPAAQTPPDGCPCAVTSPKDCAIHGNEEPAP